MATQTPYSSLAALVVDDMPVQQSTLRGQLASLGIGRVDATGTAEDAARLIRARPYQLVLCDYNLQQRSDGQQLLEHLRETGALAPDCLFFMVTAENGYASVASATEHRPDAYLLKPITAADIQERLKSLIERRHALLAVYQRIARRDWVGALAACEPLLARRDRWTMQALQLKADVLMQLGRHDDAIGVFDEALKQRDDLGWALVGRARAHQAAGRQAEARRQAEAVLASAGGERNVAAFDVLARALEASGDGEQAMKVLAEAAEKVPSARRQRLLGEAAFRQGDLGVARDALHRATRATLGALNARPQDALTLAQTLVDLGEPAQAQALLKEAGRSLRDDPSTAAAAAAIGAQALARRGDAAGAAVEARRARDALGGGRADFATVAVAKSLLLAGDEADGLALLGSAVAADHESPLLKSLVGRALADTGHGDKAAALVDAATSGVVGKVNAARRLFREGRTEDALAAVVDAAAAHPDNTGVLLQAAQLHCMALRLRRQPDAAVTERITRYLARLMQLMPGNERVAQMRRYYADTLTELQATVAAG